MDSPAILVVGSINMDLVIRCDHLPKPGETLIARDAREVPGGKGANQAVGAARLGARVHMVGCVGDDAFSGRLLEQLRTEGIDIAHVATISGTSSGVAIVAVEDSGENAILVVPGANHRLTPNAIEGLHVPEQSFDALLMQLEVPVETVLAAIQWGRRHGLPVILNPAPVPRSIDERLFDVDVLCPNQTEAEMILGRSIESKEQACEAVQRLVERGARQAVITLGAEGAVACNGHEARYFAPYRVTAIDTTAAGDAFAAGLAVQIGRHRSLWEAVDFGCAAGALAATRPGAQPGMPRYDEVRARMEQAR